MSGVGVYNFEFGNNNAPKPTAIYETNVRPPVKTWQEIACEGYKFEVVQGIGQQDLPRTIHVSNKSKFPVVFEFHKFLNFKSSAQDTLGAAEREKTIILQNKEKPIVSIEVGPGESDCYVECLKHGIYFYQESKLVSSEDTNNHRGKQDDNIKQSQLFLLQENNSGMFRYWWNQEKLTYEFERLNKLLADGDLSIEQADNDEKLPDDIKVSFEVVSVVLKKTGQGQGSPSTSQIVPRSPITTNVFMNIPQAVLFIVRLPREYQIETKDPNTRWSLNKKPQDDYLTFGWSLCGRVIFVCKPENNSPQKYVTINVKDNEECTPIYTGEPIPNKNYDSLPNTRSQQDNEINN